MKPIIIALAVLASTAGVAACGSSTGDRAISGAGVGAGVGALGGLMLGSPIEGALIGGAVGAGAGALTKEKDINLGRPIWR